MPEAIFETESSDSHGPQHPHADSVRPLGGLTGGGSKVSSRPQQLVLVLARPASPDVQTFGCLTHTSHT